MMEDHIITMIEDKAQLLWSSVKDSESKLENRLVECLQSHKGAIDKLESRAEKLEGQVDLYAKNAAGIARRKEAMNTVMNTDERLNAQLGQLNQNAPAPAPSPQPHSPKQTVTFPLRNLLAGKHIGVQVALDIAWDAGYRQAVEESQTQAQSQKARAGDDIVRNVQSAGIRHEPPCERMVPK